MTRVFVTGSSDGLGKMAADLLIEQGHKVVLHARSAARADETRKNVAGADDLRDNASARITTAVGLKHSTGSPVASPPSAFTKGNAT
jgi:NAD(P)-dependent dehydrogenase (short-subunit alcohol dehydrogenase family)